MKAIIDLFSTDYGLMSIIGILFMIGMAIWFTLFFARKAMEPPPPGVEIDGAEDED